jgi:hypothetical protein
MVASGGVEWRVESGEWREVVSRKRGNGSFAGAQDDKGGASLFLVILSAAKDLALLTLLSTLHSLLSTVTRW